MKKYHIKLIIASVIFIFAVQPVSAFDDDGYWLDEVVCYPDDDWGYDDDWGMNDDWGSQDNSWDNDDFYDNYEDDSSSNNNNNSNSSILSAEQKFVIKHPIAAAKFYSNSKKAAQAATRRYPNSIHNGKGDAFRHAYWCALNVVSENVDLARQMGNAHENDAYQPADQKAMDLHNNEVGYSIGSDAKENGWNDNQIENKVVEALNDGRLVTLK